MKVKYQYYNYFASLLMIKIIFLVLYTYFNVILNIASIHIIYLFTLNIYRTFGVIQNHDFTAICSFIC